MARVAGKLGLKPVLAQPHVKLCSYYTTGLPTYASLPKQFGHAGVIKPEMFGNDELGDCAIAGSIEEVRLLAALSKQPVPPFTTATAIQNYSAITGYVPGNQDTDQGTDVHDLYAYRKQTGIVDASGNYHKVVAYVGLEPGNFEELCVALRLFDVVGIGINCPDYIDQQFADHQPWDLVSGDDSDQGGHYISVVTCKKEQEQVGVFTWGALQYMTRAFYEAQNNVAVVAISDFTFAEGKTYEGIDVTRLQSDLGVLQQGQIL